LIGHSSQILSHLIASAESDAVRALLKFAYYILPNLEKLNVRNTVVYGVIPEFSTVILAIAYAVFYGALLFALARLMFSKKDF
jgi:ABC-type transport system involved in multi-copper enzyme maturation permease subunit